MTETTGYTQKDTKHAQDLYTKAVPAVVYSKSLSNLKPRHNTNLTLTLVYNGDNITQALSAHTPCCLKPCPWHQVSGYVQLYACCD